MLFFIGLQNKVNSFVLWKVANCGIWLNENRYAWTDEGLVAYGKAFSFSRHQKAKGLRVRRSSFRRTANLFLLQVSFVFASVRVVGNTLMIYHGLLFHCSPGTSCKVCTWLRSQISRYIWQISWRSEIDRMEVLKEARRCQSIQKLLFPVARAQGKCGWTAHRWRYTGASVFDRRQKFCKSAARLDRLAKLSPRSNGVEGQIEPKIKRCGPTGARCWCINASVTCDPCQNKNSIYFPSSGSGQFILGCANDLIKTLLQPLLCIKLKKRKNLSLILNGIQNRKTVSFHVGQCNQETCPLTSDRGALQSLLFIACIRPNAGQCAMTTTAQVNMSWYSPHTTKCVAASWESETE